MKLQNVVIAVSAVLASATSALAGSYSTNTYINGTETGYRDINITNIRTEEGTVNEFSSSLKLNTDFPNARGFIKFDGSLKGRLDVSTRNIDPSVVGGYSEQTVGYGFTDITEVTIDEHVDFSNTIYSHTLESGNN